MVWLTVLKNYLSNNINAFGLTIPFLVGVERVYGERPEFSISDLLHEAKDLDTKGKLNVYDCKQIGAHVINFKGLLYGIPDNAKVFGSIIIYQNNKELHMYDNLEYIIEHLSILYQDTIDNNLFSIVNGEWKEFDKNYVEALL